MRKQKNRVGIYLWCVNDYDDRGDEHGEPHEPEEDEEDPADAHPLRVVRVLHQLGLGQTLEKCTVKFILPHKCMFSSRDFGSGCFA